MFKVYQVAPTTKCNGICRYCHRNRYDTEIRDIDVSVADKIFTEKVFFTGLTGDPIFYPKLFHFIRKLQKNNPDIKISIATNGSIRSQAWWEQLADIMSNHPFNRIYFALDGLSDTHEIYRGTRYATVLQNLKWFRNAGGKVIWQTIYFKFNEHQIEEIQHIAEDLGCTFILKNSREYEKTGAFSKPAAVEHTDRAEMCIKMPDDVEPNCFCFDKNEIWIDTDNTVHPCCWLAILANNNTLDIKTLLWRYKEKRAEYDVGLWKLKAKNDFTKYDIDDIIKTEYFQYVKRNYKKMPICNRICRVYWKDMIRNLPKDWE
jgi:MoaA/NifB/PqqE/SkfB family radical SAM enzyme